MGLQLAAFSVLGQDMANAVPTLAGTPGAVILLPPGGGEAMPLNETSGFSDGEGVDVSSIPASELPGLGADQSAVPADAPAENDDNIERERRDTSTFGGVQSCDDDDNDGVCNQEDYCANTPAQSIVMPSGCHLSRDAPLELVGLFFDFNGSTLRPESYEILDRVVALLRQQDTVVAEVGGHTDSRGNDETNLRLSRDRAKAVYDYLVKRGIAAYRLTYRGYGSSQPVAPNQLVGGGDNADGRARNRRVDMRVVSDLATLQKKGMKELSYGH